MKALCGKTIHSIDVSEGEQHIRFATDCGMFAWETSADCCSETWFAEIIGVEALIGKTVVEVENLELPTVEDGRTRQECDVFYGIGITTSAGRAKIVFRNSSNGYYGGDIEDCSGKDLSKVKWRNITDDWTAYQTTG